MISAIGYGLGLLGNILLLLLLLTVRKPGLAKQVLILAMLLSIAWAAINTAFSLYPMPSRWLLIVDTLRAWGWLVFLVACLRDDYQHVRQLFRHKIFYLVCAIPAATLLLTVAGVAANWVFLLQTVTALGILLLLETLYRQAGETGWHYKPLVIFLGVTSLFDFVIYADATMVNQLDGMFWQARGYVYAAMLPFLVVAIRRIKHWGIKIFISRDVVLHSSLLLVAGGYLFLMALAGYAINWVGGQWTDLVQILLVIISLALLATLLLSNSFRTRIKVFITKHFFANQYDYREEWLKITALLSKPAESKAEVYQVAVNALMQAVGYQRARMVRQEQGAVTILASVNAQGINDAENRQLAQFFAYVGNNGWMLDLEEILIKPYAYAGLSVEPTLLNQCQFQLVLPIHKGDTLWALVLLDADSDHQVSLNWELRDYLSAVSAQVANYLFHHQAAAELAENAQFAAFNRMSAFVVHDLKNVLAQVDLILANAEAHKDNPAFIEDTFETLGHTRTRMQKMLKQLTDKDAVSEPLLARVAMSSLLEDIINTRCQGLKPHPELVVLKDWQVNIDAERCSNVLYHLINNAQQATGDSGTVTVELGQDGDQGIVKIIDTGCGMSERFINERLFKPFDTTKGNAGMGIGAYDARQFMERLGGKLTVVSREGQGSRFALYFPLGRQQEQGQSSNG